MTDYYATTFLEDEKPVTADLYTTIVCLLFWKKFETKRPRSRIFLRRDNPSPHTVRQATDYLVGVVHPTLKLANRHLVKLGLIKKSERKKTLSIIDRRHTARNPPTIERSVRIVKRGNPGCGLTRR
ncbi:hypothetical protein EVAR_87076_1 [Eumeta japonica]|uniref:Histone-lysine N-methyltransferase SETMAR n=1 Tax=Eumeta variegata TaxID=151549 RepID=A0A4C1VSM1_EUMVA|nr:hypothetical protein EVAR_87076_1 [Eumeta japonica]